MNKEISIQENNPGLRGKENELFTDVCRIIDGARDRIATHLNTEPCLTNWYIWASYQGRCSLQSEGRIREASYQEPRKASDRQIWFRLEI